MEKALFETLEKLLENKKPIDEELTILEACTKWPLSLGRAFWLQGKDTAIYFLLDIPKSFGSGNNFGKVAPVLKLMVKELALYETNITISPGKHVLPISLWEFKSHIEKTLNSLKEQLDSNKIEQNLYDQKIENFRKWAFIDSGLSKTESQ